MAAMWMRARSELRAGKRSLLALALLMGVFGGVTMAAAAGARRTDSAYDRFIAATTPPDAFVASGTTRSGGRFPFVPLRHVLHLPQIQRGFIEPFLSGEVLDRNGRVLVSENNLSIDEIATTGAAAALTRVKVLRGRLPDPKSTNEIAIGYDPALDRQTPVGSNIRLALVKPDLNPSLVVSGAVSQKDLLPPVTLRVVGVVLYGGELQGSADVFLGPALYRTYVGRSLPIPALNARLKQGVSEYPAFSRAVQALAPGAIMFSAGNERDFVYRSTHVFALALWMFAALAALAGALVFGQALLRQIFVDATETPGLRALGMTGDQLFGVAMLRTAVVAVAGSVIAVVVAFLLSTFLPLGHLARLAEPNPGFSFDSIVLLTGMAVLIATTFAIGAVPAWRTARLRGDTQGAVEPPRSRPSPVAAAFAGAGLAPTAVAGVRMALEPGRGRTATPVRSALVGAALSVAAVVAAMTFGASLRHLVDTPRLYGIGWQYQAGSFFTAPQVGADLERDPHIGSITAAGVESSVALGSLEHPVQADVFATQAIRGSLHPTVVDGRWPSTPSEIALGGKTLRATGAGVGSTITVRAGGRLARMRIVGKVVLPSLGFGPGLGDGAGLTFDGLRRLLPKAPTDGFGFDFRRGTDVPAEIRRLDRELHRIGSRVENPLRSTQIDTLAKIEGLPLAMAGLLALAALAAVAHLLVTSIRRRRRDLSILKTLGFVRRQVWATVAWQASCVAVVALVVGLPVGLAAGRWAWNAFADNLGVAPEPAVPIATALLVIPIALLAANVIAALPGRVAARVRPAVVLRTE